MDHLPVQRSNATPADIGFVNQQIRAALGPFNARITALETRLGGGGGGGGGGGPFGGGPFGGGGPSTPFNSPGGGGGGSGSVQAQRPKAFLPTSRDYLAESRLGGSVISRTLGASTPFDSPGNTVGNNPNAIGGGKRTKKLRRTKKLNK